MNFKEYLDTLKPLEEYEVEILLDNGENYIVENKPGKQGSLRVVQNHLGDKIETTEKIDLTNFQEFYLEWQANPETTHPTIGFLDRFNKEGGIIRRRVNEIIAG